MSDEVKKKAINRVQARYAFRAFEDKMYQKTVEASQAGEPTCWAMAVYWQVIPILRSMGFEIIYTENFGAYSAATGVAQTYLDRSDSEGFPTHLCSYARINLGYSAMMNELGEIPPGAPAGGIAKPTLLLSRGGVCDAGYKWFQALARYFDAPLWVVEHPHPGVKEFFKEGYYEHTINFLVDSLREFVRFVEHLLGKKLDWDKLDQLVCNLDKATHLWQEINDLRQAVPCPMHSRDFWTCMVPHYFHGDVVESQDLYRQLYDEIKHRVDTNTGAVEEEKYRLIFSELPPWHSLGFFENLAERGWNFVQESINYHLRTIDLTGISDPLKRLAMISFNFHTGYFKEALKESENLGFLAAPYLMWTDEYKADGAFLHPLLSCRACSVHIPYLQARLIEARKVPSLIIEGDMCDLTRFDPADALRRAETFEETMDYYRGRREKGFTIR
jgi:benzoyl-CoA reductase/2-hydroxyglutaryl-CoA dehydratase subunit BcrC/BadD/HgdB